MVRVDKNILDNYLETLKTLNIKMGADLERYMAEVYRTQGLVIKEQQAEEMIRIGKAMLEEVSTLRETITEAYSDAMISDVDHALARKLRDGSIRQITFDTLSYYIKEISVKHHTPNISVITCMRQRSYEIYKDNNGELDRILNLLESIHDDIKGVEIK